MQGNNYANRQQRLLNHTHYSSMDLGILKDSYLVHEISNNVTLFFILAKLGFACVFTFSGKVIESQTPGISHDSYKPIRIITHDLFKGGLMNQL